MLEVIVSVVVIAAIMVFVGVPLETVLALLAMLLLGALVLSMLLFVLFFYITDIMLLFRRRVKGKFLRVDDSGRFDHAVYLAEGEEYACVFPAESVGRRMLYKEEQEYSLLISRNPKRRTAFDRHSLFIIAVGTAVSLIFTAALVFAVYVMIQMGEFSQ